MAISTAPINEKTKALLREVSEMTGLSWVQILEEAMLDYRGRVFLDRVEGAGPTYMALWVDPQVWGDVLPPPDPWEEPVEEHLEPDKFWTGDDRYVLREEDILQDQQQSR